MSAGERKSRKEGEKEEWKQKERTSMERERRGGEREMRDTFLENRRRNSQDQQSHSNLILNNRLQQLSYKNVY